MPRRPREEMAGGIYHVYARAIRDEPLFQDDDDRRSYLSAFGGTARELGWRPLAYCLMTTHVHHLIELREPNLGHGFMHTHGSYARDFNEKHATGGGHLFEKRYGSSRATSAGAAMYFACYVLLNPIRAHMCDRPEDHQWSSAAASLGLRTAERWLDTTRLLDVFGGGDRFERVLEAVAIMGAAGFEPATSRV